VLGDKQNRIEHLEIAMTEVAALTWQTVPPARRH
jgi:hypothetical protein